MLPGKLPHLLVYLLHMLYACFWFQYRKTIFYVKGKKTDLIMFSPPQAPFLSSFLLSAIDIHVGHFGFREIISINTLYYNHKIQ